VESDKRVVGIRIGLAALEFEVILDRTGLNLDHLKQNSFYRPWIVSISSQQRTHTLVVSWPSDPVGSETANVRLLPAKAKG
jgi:hypothetical protein